MAASMNSGSEGIDLAIKIARKWGHNVKGIQSDEAKILTVTGNYHGKTLGPLSGSSNKDIKEGEFEKLPSSHAECGKLITPHTAGFGPFLPNIGPSVAGFPVRFNSLEDIKTAFNRNGTQIAAVIIECVQGYGGCLPAEPGYLRGVRDLCKQHQILLIADEIQTGFGRTGALMAYQHEDIKPDMVVLGKALTGGLYPMSLIVGKRSVMTQIKPGE